MSGCGGVGAQLAVADTQVGMHRGGSRAIAGPFSSRQGQVMSGDELVPAPAQVEVLPEGERQPPGVILKAVAGGPFDGGHKILIFVLIPLHRLIIDMELADCAAGRGRVQWNTCPVGVELAARIMCRMQIAIQDARQSELALRGRFVFCRAQADIWAWMQAKQPEHMGGGRRQLPVGAGEHRSDVDGDVSRVQRIEPTAFVA